MQRVSRLGLVMRLVRIVENARLRGPNRLHVEHTLREASGLHQDWLRFVGTVYGAYRERTQPDNVDTPLTRDDGGNSLGIIGMDFDDEEEQKEVA